MRGGRGGWERGERERNSVRSGEMGRRSEREREDAHLEPGSLCREGSAWGPA